MRAIIGAILPSLYELVTVPEFSRQGSGHNCTKDAEKCYSR